MDTIAQVHGMCHPTTKFGLNNSGLNILAFIKSWSPCVTTFTTEVKFSRCIVRKRKKENKVAHCRFGSLIF